MKNVSPKRVVDLELYRFLKSVRFGPGVGCELRVTGCTVGASEVHHRQSRGVAPSRIFDVDNWLAACRSCHRWVTDNPAESYDLGLSQRAGELDPPGAAVYRSTCRSCFSPVLFVHDERGRSIVLDVGPDGPVESRAGSVRPHGEEVPFHADMSRRVVLAGVVPDGIESLLVDHRATCG